MFKHVWGGNLCFLTEFPYSRRFWIWAGSIRPETVGLPSAWIFGGRIWSREKKAAHDWLTVVGAAEIVTLVDEFKFHSNRVKEL